MLIDCALQVYLIEKSSDVKNQAGPPAPKPINDLVNANPIVTNNTELYAAPIAAIKLLIPVPIIPNINKRFLPNLSILKKNVI